MIDYKKASDQLNETYYKTQLECICDRSYLNKIPFKSLEIAYNLLKEYRVTNNTTTAIRLCHYLHACLLVEDIDIDISRLLNNAINLPF